MPATALAAPKAEPEQMTSAAVAEASAPCLVGLHLRGGRFEN